ncbi:MAG: hypothetical protein V3S46_03390 [Nitrospinota bacterium]
MEKAFTGSTIKDSLTRISRLLKKQLLRKNFKFFSILTIAVIFIPPMAASPSFAHAPLFMLAPEAPGKGAFDMHTSITHGRQGEERHTEFEQEFTYGLTRGIAAGISIPFAREEEFPSGEEQSSKTGIENPNVFGQFRFWDKDLPGKKYSSAIRLASTIPVGDKSMARNKPDFMAGAAYGMESLKWYYMADLRYLYHVEDAGSKPGDRFFADAAVGLRPELRGLEETDTVFFLEFNYMNEPYSKTGGVKNPDTGGTFFFISPEILISPSNRIMIRAGVQIPIYQDLNGMGERKDFTFKLVLETRY